MSINSQSASHKAIKDSFSQAASALALLYRDSKESYYLGYTDALLALQQFAMLASLDGTRRTQSDNTEEITIPVRVLLLQIQKTLQEKKRIMELSRYKTQLRKRHRIDSCSESENDDEEADTKQKLDDISIS